MILVCFVPVHGIWIIMEAETGMEVIRHITSGFQRIYLLPVSGGLDVELTQHLSLYGKNPLVMKHI